MPRHLGQGYFLRSRADQLADYLRGCITRGELREPFPTIRTLRSKLGVGKDTLERALKALERQKMLRIQPRKGIQLLRAAGMPQRERISGESRVVRWVYYGKKHQDMSSVAEVLLSVSEHLNVHDIHLSVEKCDIPRLKAIHRAGESANEMLLLVDLSEKYQRLFADFRKSVLLFAQPFPGILLPYVTIDVLPALRHAIHGLVRRGFQNITLVLKEGSREYPVEAFHRFCAEAPHPLQARVVKLPMSYPEQAFAARRFAAGLKGRHGVVAVYSISASILMTALLKAGLDVPCQVEVVAVNTTRQAVRVFPVPTYYPYPMDALASVLCKAAVQYFDRGEIPPLRKFFPLEVVSATAS